MNQVLVLSISTAVLAFLSFFHVFSEGADISALNDELSHSTVIYDYKGDMASKISANKQEGVPIEDIPDHVIHAVLAIEDHRFYEHGGVDYQGIARAFYKNVKAGGLVEGGSTITQQLTKNALLTSEKTFERKFEEFFLAREIEKQYTKDEILQMYLNRIYFGNGSYGIKRAAMDYFGKEPKELTLSEAAVLAGLIKAPSALDPFNNYDGAMERRDVVLHMMHKHDFISEEEKNQSLGEEIALNEQGRDPLRGKYPYYVDHVIDEAISKYGLTQDEILTNGYKIYTELDVDMQTAIEDTYSNDELFPEGTEKQQVQSGAVLLDPKTGGVRALVGGRGEHVFRGYNRATKLKAQPGSTMKPIAVAVPALEEGWEITDLLKDEETDFNGYKPSNFKGEFRGEVPMHEAMKDSLNVPIVWLLDEIGVAKGMQAVEKFGIPLQKEDRNLAIALGGLSTGVSPMDMAGAYSAFANNGVRTETHAITRIEDGEGNIIAEWKEEKTDATSKEVTDQINSMLLNVVEEGTGKGARLSDRELAGKTGSTQVPIEGVKGTKDQWFVGYTPQLVGAIWVGYDKTDSEHYLTTTSSEGAAKIFKDFMTKSLKDTEPVSFNVPSIEDYEKQNTKKEKEDSKKKLKNRDKIDSQQNKAEAGENKSKENTVETVSNTQEAKKAKPAPKKAENHPVKKAEASKKETKPAKEEQEKKEPRKEEPAKKEPAEKEQAKEKPAKKEPAKKETGEPSGQDGDTQTSQKAEEGQKEPAEQKEKEENNGEKPAGKNKPDKEPSNKEENKTKKADEGGGEEEDSTGDPQKDEGQPEESDEGDKD
jgi:penicillin-binding protein 2A